MSLTATRGVPATEGPGGQSPDRLLIDADEVGHLCGWSGRSTRRKDSAGLIPRPIKCGGAVRWRIDEIKKWICVGCPDRATWDRMERA